MYHKLAALTSLLTCLVIVIELTCFETNLIYSRNFKIEKYKNIKRYSKVTVNKIETFFSGSVITRFYCKNI